MRGLRAVELVVLAVCVVLKDVFAIFDTIYAMLKICSVSNVTPHMVQSNTFIPFMSYKNVRMLTVFTNHLCYQAK
jgi:hypothetical protein